MSNQMRGRVVPRSARQALAVAVLLAADRGGQRSEVAVVIAAGSMMITRHLWHGGAS